MPDLIRYIFHFESLIHAFWKDEEKKKQEEKLKA